MDGDGAAAFALVTVGRGTEATWRTNMLGMTREDILLGLVKHPLFKSEFAGVENPHDCRVYVVTVPPAAGGGCGVGARTRAAVRAGAEAGRGKEQMVELETTKVVGDVARRKVTRTISGKAYVHIHIDRPPALAGSGGGATVAGVKRTRAVTSDIPPPGVIVTVRDMEAKHRSTTIVVPPFWDALLARLRKRCGYADSHRLYYFTEEVMPKKKKLASAEDFAMYNTELAEAGRLPDLWVLRPCSGWQRRPLAVTTTSPCR